MVADRDAYVVVLRAPDRPGLVRDSAEAVLRADGDIVHADQHADVVHGLFLQRLEVTVPTGAGDALREELARMAASWPFAWSVHDLRVPVRTAVLLSRTGHCAYDLLVRADLGELPLDVRGVISDHADHAELGPRFGVPFHHVPAGPDRAEHEAQITAALAPLDVDLVVLARYMRILSAELVGPYEQRMINIHHSFLPAFVGGGAYRQAWERGVKLIGATAHYVTADLDAGPIIAQATAPVTHRDGVDDLVRIGRDLETQVLAAAVRAHVERRVIAYGNRTVVFGA